MPQPLRATFVPYASLPGKYQDVRHRVPDHDQGPCVARVPGAGLAEGGLAARWNGTAHVARPGWLLKRETPTSPPRRHRGRSLRIVVRCGARQARLPAGLTGISLAGQVGLAWQRDGRSDRVLRLPRDDSTSITTLRSHRPEEWRAPRSPTAVARTDTTYYYAVRAITGGIESANSLTVQATPDRACVLDRQRGRARELLPGHHAAGTSATRPRSRPAVSRASRTAPSINKGSRVDLKVNSDDAAHRSASRSTGWATTAAPAPPLLDHSRACRARRSRLHLRRQPPACSTARTGRSPRR